MTVDVRVFKVIAGFGLLAAGIVMLVVPGPGWLTIAAGLAVLAAEFPWARRALDTIKRAAATGRQRLTRGTGHGAEDSKADHEGGDAGAPGTRSR